MTSLEQESERRFRYRAVTREGRQVRDTVRAADELTALRELMAGGLTVTELAEADRIEVRSADRDLSSAERVLVMRQLALMLEAGVTLLEALETVAAGVSARRGRAQLMEVIAALKRGEALGVALKFTRRAFPTTCTPWPRSARPPTPDACPTCCAWPPSRWPARTGCAAT